MRRPKSVLTVLALLVTAAMGTIYAQPAQAHAASSHYPDVWPDGADVEFYFDDGFPSGAYRSRMIDARFQWNSATSTSQEPDFLPAGQIASNGDPRDPCSFTRNIVFWADLDYVSTNTLGFATWCFFDHIEVFTISIDSDRSWYNGTGNAPSGNYDLWSVGTHEFGHAGGFSGHWPESDGTLCPNDSTRHTMCSIIYIGTERQRTPATHDKHTFDAAY